MSKYKEMSNLDFDMQSYDEEECTIDMALADLNERIAADRMIDGN